LRLQRRQNPLQFVGLLPRADLRQRHKQTLIVCELRLKQTPAPALN
jgi:hypothetical protein